jgi:hypothetical protein
MKRIHVTIDRVVVPARVDQARFAREIQLELGRMLPQSFLSMANGQPLEIPRLEIRGHAKSASSSVAAALADGIAGVLRR